MENFWQNIDNWNDNVWEISRTNDENQKILDNLLLQLWTLEKDLYSESDWNINIKNPDSLIDKEYLSSIENAKKLTEKIKIVWDITNKFLEIKKQPNNSRILNRTDLFNNIEQWNYSLQELKNSKEFLRDSENVAIQSLYKILSQIDKLSINWNNPKIQDVQNIIKDIFSDKIINDNDAENLIKLNNNLSNFYNLWNIKYDDSTNNDLNNEKLIDKNKRKEYVEKLRKDIIESRFYELMPVTAENLIKGFADFDSAKWDIQWNSISFWKNIWNIVECFDWELNIDDIKILTNSLSALMHMWWELVHIVTNLVKDINIHLFQPYEVKDKNWKVIIKKWIVVQWLEEWSSIIIEWIDDSFSFLKDITPDSWNDEIDTWMNYTQKSIDGLKDGFILADAAAFWVINWVADFVDWWLSFPFELDATMYKIKKAFTWIELDNFLSSMWFDNIKNVWSSEKIAEIIWYILTLIVATIYTLWAWSWAIANWLAKLWTKFPNMTNIINKFWQNIDKFQWFVKSSVAVPEYNWIIKWTYNIAKKWLSKIPTWDIKLIQKVLEVSWKTFKQVEIYGWKSIEWYNHLIHKLHHSNTFNNTKYTWKTIYWLNEYWNKFVARVSVNGKIQQMITI